MSTTGAWVSNNTATVSAPLFPAVSVESTTNWFGPSARTKTLVKPATPSTSKCTVNDGDFTRVSTEGLVITTAGAWVSKVTETVSAPRFPAASVESTTNRFTPSTKENVLTKP